MPPRSSLRGVFIAAACLSLAPLAARAASGPFAYVSPRPGSIRVSAVNNVAIRPGGELDPLSVHDALLAVVGERSGAHVGQVKLSSDGRTLLFKPVTAYAAGERVTVRLAPGLRTLSGDVLPEYTFGFTVSAADPARLPRFEPREFAALASNEARARVAAPAAAPGPCDTLLPEFPLTTLNVTGTPGPGCWFMAPFNLTDQTKALLQILDDRGVPIYQRVHYGAWLPVDFKPQPDGRLTFWLNNPFRFLVMDSSYVVVDTITTGNGYAPDLHELQVLPNGHMLIMSYDPQPVGMDTVVVGGNPNAIVYGLIVQELDENKDVVFQWRSWDHFLITDGAVSPLTTITGASVDYVHGNSIAMGPDGNLVISSRHMNELTKIDRNTGDILWRMGLNAAHNDFTFPNDTRGFSHTHDARVLPNGHLTVFDNGNFLVPQYSRALEFELDETNKIATLVSEFRRTPDVYGGFMGNVQRHDDTTTTVGWGGTFGTFKVTELDRAGAVAAELVMPGSWVNYRTLRAPWRTNRFVLESESLTVSSPGVGQPGEGFVKLWNKWDRPITLTCIRTLDPAFDGSLLNVTLPRVMLQGETLLVHVQYTAASTDTARSRLYVMQLKEGELVAQTLDLVGITDESANVGVTPEARLALFASPNPTLGRSSIEFVLPQSGHVDLDVFDVSGRWVATLARGRYAAGRHRVEWDASRQGPGLYFQRLRAGGQTRVSKLVLEN